MKKKLGIAFTLIALSLMGIIVFQGYWTVNAYRVNKKQFERNIDSAMIRALDDCKKDYFDSIRVVLIKRMSPLGSFFRIDTDTVRHYYNIYFGSSTSAMDRPYGIPEANLNYYKNKTRIKNDPVALITEMSFYVPSLMSNITWMLSFDDLSEDGGKTWGVGAIQMGENIAMPTMMAPRGAMVGAGKTLDKLKTKPVFNMAIGAKIPHLGLADTGKKRKLALLNALYANSKPPRPGNAPMQPVLQDKKPDTTRHFKLVKRGIYDMPPHFKQADSLRLFRHFKDQLSKIGIDAPFSLLFADKTEQALHPNAYYSETSIYEYKYHGWQIFNHTAPTFYAKATFNSPQYAIMKSMLFNLLFSTLLIALTGFCFVYVYRTILQQKKLGEHW